MLLFWIIISFCNYFNNINLQHFAFWRIADKEYLLKWVIKLSHQHLLKNNLIDWVNLTLLSNTKRLTYIRKINTIEEKPLIMDFDMIFSNRDTNGINHLITILEHDGENQRTAAILSPTNTQFSELFEDSENLPNAMDEVCFISFLSSCFLICFQVYAHLLLNLSR